MRTKPFTEAPVLLQPDTTGQFVVEVNTSDIGVGAVFSQSSVVDEKLHPCTFLSHHLSPAESNCDVRGRELLAIKTALK